LAFTVEAILFFVAKNGLSNLAVRRKSVDDDSGAAMQAATAVRYPAAQH
jgi:hypothetical protein